MVGPYDPDDPQLDIRFTLTVLDGLSTDDALGTVSFEIPRNAFDDRFRTAIFEEEADSGKVKMTFIARESHSRPRPLRPEEPSLQPGELLVGEQPSPSVCGGLRAVLTD